MDPLSITAAAVSFVDIAMRIKDSVQKVGQTRHNLQLLAEDIIEELTELQKLCQDGQRGLNPSDPESTRSLNQLHSELEKVLKHCLSLAERRQANKGISSVKYHFLAWLKNAEIEARVLRLRKRVSTVHRRFTITTSLKVQRTVNELLVYTSDQRARLSQLESLMSPLFITSHASGTYPASALDHASIDGFDYQFLRRQVRRTTDLLARVSVVYTFTIQETRGPPARRPIRNEWSHAGLVRMAIIATLQLLELGPSNLALWEGAQHVIDLGDYLYRLGLEDDAAAVFIGVAKAYRILMQRSPSTYLPYVAWGLMHLSLTRSQSPENLNAANQAVGICKETVAMLLGED